MCRAIIDSGLKITFTCNSRVDFVDREMLQLMAKAGCFYIAWGLESGSKEILGHARKGVDPDRARQSLAWAREAGIKNWGYFIIGLPGETEQTIRQTIAFAKGLPLDIALFHIAAPYPGTPFFHEVVRNGWFRPGVRWEEVDMDESTVLDYPDLQRGAARVLAEAGLPRVGAPARPDPDLSEDAAVRPADVRLCASTWACSISGGRAAGVAGRRRAFTGASREGRGLSLRRRLIVSRNDDSTAAGPRTGARACQPRRMPRRRSGPCGRSNRRPTRSRSSCATCSRCCSSGGGRSCSSPCSSSSRWRSRPPSAERLYRSTALVQIDPEPVQVLPYREIDLPSIAQNYDIFMKSQEQILRGPTLVLRIGENLRQRSDAPKLQAEVPRLWKRLSIQRLETTQMFRLMYVAGEPETAAAVANAFAEEYIKLQFETRQETRKKARELLERELEALEQRRAACRRRTSWPMPSGTASRPLTLDRISCTRSWASCPRSWRTPRRRCSSRSPGSTRSREPP